MPIPFHHDGNPYTFCFRNISPRPQNIAAISGSSKCADCRVQIEALQSKMYALNEQIKEQQYEITSLHKRNQYLKTFEPEHVKRAEKCSVCKSELTTDELYFHLCQRTNNNNGSDTTTIRCEYCLKSYGSTMQLLNHLRCVGHDRKHEQKKFYRCEQCPEIFGMAKLMEMHMSTHPHKEQPKIATSTQNHDDDDDEHVQTQSKDLFLTRKCACVEFIRDHHRIQLTNNIQNSFIFFCRFDFISFQLFNVDMAIAVSNLVHHNY